MTDTDRGTALLGGPDQFSELTADVIAFLAIVEKHVASGACQTGFARVALGNGAHVGATVDEVQTVVTA